MWTGNPGSEVARAWTLPEPLAEGDDHFDESADEPGRQWAGELVSPFAGGLTVEPEETEIVENRVGSFSVEHELLTWAAELAHAPREVREALSAVERLEDEESGGFLDIVRDVLAANAVNQALAGGELEENKLTDAGYRALPGGGAKIKANDPDEPKERWTRIRDRIVRPALRLKKTGLDRLVPRKRPFGRPCCLLFGTFVLDVPSLGTHGTRPLDALGEVYTRKLGFIDLGHARETADVTLWALTQLRENAAAGTAIQLMNGSARLSREIPLERRLALAQQLAYVDSVEHEIVTFGVPGAGFDNSSFSPEDLPSNLFGILVAVAAFRADGGSDTAITQQFKQMLQAAGAEAKAVAERVQAAAAARGWWGPAPNGGPWWDFPLLKRNFTADPWLIDEHGSVRIGHGALPAAPLSTGADFEYTSSGSAHLKNSEFAREIARIRGQVPATAVTP